MLTVKFNNALENEYVYGDMTDEILFDAQVLSRLDKIVLPLCEKHGVSYKNPGRGLQFRPLQISDYDKGYVQLLGQLTKLGVVDEETYQRQFKAMKSTGCHYVFVIEDLDKHTVIANATLLIEHKFTHTGAQRGRVEDVVVHDDYRGQHLGILMLETLTMLGKVLGCYKISLDCTSDMVAYYKKFGYQEGPPVFMCQKFFD